MALKFNTQLMKVADEFADFDVLKPKAQPDPHFDTQQTESMFILTVHLKGYTQANIKVSLVEINGDGCGITISGQKPFQEMLMVGGRVVKKDIETRGFQNLFKVPKTVILGQVNARFNENESELVIRMPKATKGLIGDQLEELKAEETQLKPAKVLHIYTNEELLEQETQEVRNGDVGKEDDNDDDDKKQEAPRRKFKICTPIMVGSAFVMSLIVLVFHLVESKKRENPRKKRSQD
ncbi:hypothetical protein R6Q59_009494 [Mikania micrantha]|uniref:SHSP domain-containing protein n=1 Tax=Mikania micrantha TaxID=192012 RepID=A0A5N6N8Y1_9ASTR|nr:hypothetical protein E3N88_26415 [Mikania micrantha]